MSQKVLIADAKDARARAIGKLCTNQGVQTFFASDGPTALQLALAELPTMVILALQLPLIDGAKLAEILRTNPRTQNTRFLFVSERSLGGRQVEFYDEVICEPIDLVTLGQRIEEIFVRSEKLDALGEEVERADKLSGRLSQVSLPDLLQLFQINRKTGVLELQRKEKDSPEERGVIELSAGNVAQARLGEVEKEKALFRFFHWTDGTFAFTPKEIKGAPKITAATRELLMEGIRQLDEWNQRKNALPALDAYVALRVKKSDLPKMVHPLSQEILLLLEVYPRVRDIVDHCSFPDYAVLQALHTLSIRGIIQLRESTKGTPPAPREALFTAAQARRLRDWVDVRSARGAKLADAKLLLASSEIETTQRFAKILRAVPGIRLEGAFAGNTFATDDLLTMAKLPVDSEVGIRLLHVPTVRTCAPAWPVIGYGSLALITLLGTRSSKSVREIHLVRELMASLPESRCFFVAFAEAATEAARRDLQAELALADENAVFVLPIKEEEECQRQLRSLLGKILP